METDKPYQTIKEILERIYQEHAESHPVNNVAWWILVTNSCEENMTDYSKEDLAWVSLLNSIRKITTCWLKKRTKWHPTSLTTFSEIISKVPGATLATSLPTIMSTSVIALWISCANMEEIGEQECSDFLSKVTTSTSSTTVHSAEDTAEISGGEKLNLLASLGQLAPKTNQSGSYSNTSGTMSSSISFLENGELVKYGLEEKVGKHRLTVGSNDIVFIFRFTMSLLLIAELVRWQEKFDSGQMVRSEDSGSDSIGERQSNKRTRRATHQSLGYEVYGKKSKSSSKFGYIREKTKALLLRYYCSPVSAIRDVKEFRDDITLSDPKNKDYIQASFDDFGKDVNEMTLRQIKEMLDVGEPQFIASMVYGNREDSLDIVNQLLRFQFNDDDAEICKFLQALVDVLDRKIPKCNSLSILSPPSAGKNFFMDMIFALCLNYGQLGQANKNNVFAFQEAPNKRVLVWNEPNYESGLTDTIKMMLGGDPYTVRVKHNMDTHVKRTPVIILTNQMVNFMFDIAFRDRLIQFNWKEAPFLKNIDYKPYPMCFFDLLNKYNITIYTLSFYIGTDIVGYKPAIVAPCPLGSMLNNGHSLLGNATTFSPSATFGCVANGNSVGVCSVTIIVACTSQ